MAFLRRSLKCLAQIILLSSVNALVPAQTRPRTAATVRHATVSETIAPLKDAVAELAALAAITALAVVAALAALAAFAAVDVARGGAATSVPTASAAASCRTGVRRRGHEAATAGQKVCEAGAEATAGEEVCKAANAAAASTATVGLGRTTSHLHEALAVRNRRPQHVGGRQRRRECRRRECQRRACRRRTCRRRACRRGGRRGARSVEI